MPPRLVPPRQDAMGRARLGDELGGAAPQLGIFPWENWEIAESGKVTNIATSRRNSSSSDLQLMLVKRLLGCIFKQSYVKGGTHAF